MCSSQQNEILYCGIWSVIYGFSKYISCYRKQVSHNRWQSQKSVNFWTPLLWPRQGRGTLTSKGLAQQAYTAQPLALQKGLALGWFPWEISSQPLQNSASFDHFLFPCPWAPWCQLDQILCPNGVIYGERLILLWGWGVSSWGQSCRSYMCPTPSKNPELLGLGELPWLESWFLGELNMSGHLQQQRTPGSYTWALPDSASCSFSCFWFQSVSFGCNNNCE